MGQEPTAAERTRNVKLGEHVYTVVAQRHSYLKRKLGPMVGQLGNLSAGSETDRSQLLDSATQGYYDLIKVFIPDLMPKWEWEGFSSQTAFDQGEEGYDEEADKAPNIDQMVIAAEAALHVNRLDLFKYVKELVGPDFLKLLRKRVEVELATYLTETAPPRLGASDSPSSPPPSGESPPTNGGTSHLTSV